MSELSKGIEQHLPTRPALALCPPLKPPHIRLWAAVRSRGRALAIGWVVIVALAVLGRELHGHYAIEQWLFWKYAKAVPWAIAWVSACVLLGLGLVERLCPSIPLRERLVLGSGCGVYVYYVLQFFGGVLGWFGPLWAVALLLAMLLTGVWLTRKTVARVWRFRGRFRFAFGASTLWQAPIALFGLGCLVWLYLSILTPKNAAFDSLWYHLGLAEGWAAEGGIVRSPEGWFMAALPDMAAMLYSFAFLLPSLDLFETLTVAAHIEFLLFLVTLASIPVAVRVLVPRVRVGVSWVALFLFPSLFIYDASLHSGNDHIAAFFALPIFLALRRVWLHPDWRNAVLLALCACGALLTKYQAASLLLGPALAVLLRLAVLAIRQREFERAGRVLASALLGSLVFSAPLWAKNWLWYGDPFYPALHRKLALHPWTEEAASYMDLMWKVNVWRPQGTLGQQLLETLQKGFTFSFESHAHRAFHGDWPYVGSLFTLSLAWLPFVRGAKRTWGLVACTQLGIFTWYFMSYVERYLQLLLPWMAVVVVAALVLAWRQGWFARVPLLLLVLLQVVWGGDAMFLRSHAMLRELPLVHTARLMESGFKQDWALRDSPGGTFQSIGDALPEGSTLLLHDHNGRVGLRHRVVVDKPRYTGLISYGAMNSAADVFALYKDLGVSHVVWRKESNEYSSLAADFRFFEFAENVVERPAKFGSFSVGTLPEQMPVAPSNDLMLYAGCSSTFTPGLYHLQDSHVVQRPPQKVRGFRSLPRNEAGARDLLSQAQYLAYSEKCRGALPYPAPGFRLVAKRREEELWVRPW